MKKISKKLLFDCGIHSMGAFEDIGIGEISDAFIFTNV